MRENARKECAAKKGKFNANNCQCTDSEEPQPATTCVDSGESNEHSGEVVTQKPCDCTCSPDCKKRKLIIDVLLKYFYRDVYDRDCCKKSCNCKGAKFPECDEANSPKTAQYDVLAKLFKPQGEKLEAGSIEIDGKKISKDKREKLSKAFKSAIEGLEDVLKS
jgi:hypothetical protein